MARVLLVDDEAHVRSVMAFKLKSAGYEVVTACDGQEGLETAQIERPDLVITDCQMPRMSGLDLARRLSEHAATASTPLIMVTSRDFEIGEEQVRGTNIRRLLNKPFSPKHVLSVVREVLGEPALPAC
jgi:CheY-like chemotaxis protein